MGINIRSGMAKPMQIILRILMNNRSRILYFLHGDLKGMAYLQYSKQNCEETVLAAATFDVLIKSNI